MVEDDTSVFNSTKVGDDAGVEDGASCVVFDGSSGIVVNYGVGRIVVNGASRAGNVTGVVDGTAIVEAT